MDTQRRSSPAELPPPRLIVFDLDGTLIDSRQDLCNSLNATLRHFGKPELPDAVIASYNGDGASMLVRRALGDPEGDAHDEQYVADALHFFLDFYRIHKLDFTYVYPGVFEALESIQRSSPNVLMACLTNKPVGPSLAICQELGLTPYFFRTYGGNSFHTKKPDPHGLLELINEASSLAATSAANPLEILPAQTVMVGDSAVDVLTARACGARSIGCTFGLAPESLLTVPPDALASSPTDWPSLLGVLRVQDLTRS